MITQDLLFKYFRGRASREEKIAISRWLEENEDNKRAFRESSDLYEEFIMTAPARMLELQDTPVHDGGHIRIWSRKLWLAAANVAAVAVIALCTWLVLDNKYENRLADSMVTVEIPAGHRMDITLEDGTVAKLNSGAKLRYPKSFMAKKREVYLEGEACFDVTHNAKRPFVVSTFAAQVEVLGTEFNVNADEEYNEFSTTLIEGRVRVTSMDNPENSVTITPSQKVTMDKGNMRIENVDVSESLLWTDGILDITGTDFRKLVKRMENAYGVKIVIQREDIPELGCVGGKVRISDGIDHALGLLGSLSGFQYVNDRQNGTIYIK